MALFCGFFIVIYGMFLTLSTITSA